ncbi:unnamed protein product (macronuclear) [Paramecium tetraurelia]|uniref:Uncharacterized protein n=1 Tax=Paramecium tetraurelia TaxID=5888 RepID=A0E7C6_PARTE|nr:uncharacterized protein GSPATT00023921001 [Paramecium tetraurelia]CAK91193.1 unnamed protein product [Paramecium tetraurelia]|eukprot:XP_001458590.1 hypothetical protein (macronuclear) [Paramecium tetraurelia strain d4-2]
MSSQNKLVTQEIEGIIWNYSLNPPEQLKCKFQIRWTQDQKVQYILDGCILRIDSIYNTSKKAEVLTNLEQIKHLRWIGQYGQNNLKVGKWLATWKGETLKDVGGEYLNDEKKQGIWKDIVQNYQTNSQAYIVGRYENGLKLGKWQYIYNDKEIGGGNYNQQGVQVGLWQELSDGFWDQKQVTHNGEYRIGKKVGRWNIKYERQIIGGGSYNVESNQKCGKWIELSENFSEDSKVIYEGQYQKDKKIGLWDILYKSEKDQPFKQIGGGVYLEGLKTGKWIELRDNFENYSQVTQAGQYKKNNKVGRWDTWFIEKDAQTIKLIGGGFYTNGGDGIKIGKWIELSDGFWDRSQVFYTGEYQNGKKVGRWEISYWKDYEDNNQNQQLGGGSYSKVGDGLKVGNWVEPSEGFYENSQVTYNGEYKDGKKIGRWDIRYRKDNKFEKIAGGLYSETGDGIKIGKWVELSDGFYDHSQITYDGEYIKGKKHGRWDIKQRIYKDNIQIGGGSYEEGIKIGNWIELSDKFDNWNQLIYIGEYKKEKKVGVWVQKDRNKNENHKEMRYDD